MPMPLRAEEIAGLIDQHAAALRLWLGSRCASPEDAVQEAFCRLANVEPPPDRPAAWLYRVARNLADKQRTSDGRRQRRERMRATPESFQVDPAAGLERAEAMAAVGRLSDELREVLVARIWGQLTLDEVGKVCGISTATAMRRYEAALKMIRTELDPPCKTNRP
jgi:RNA polymerase sigma-70 factor (ECF subfamily)